MKLVSKFHRIFSKKHYSQYHHTSYTKFNPLKIWTLTASLGTLCLIVYLYRTSYGYCDEHSIGNTVRTICNQYYKKQASGPLCEIMCAKEIYLNQRPEDQTKGYYCPSRTADKRVLLIGTTGDGYNYYLRETQTTIFERGSETTSPSSTVNKQLDPITWNGHGGKKHYPTEEEFLQMVNTTIYFHYNMTLSDEKLKLLLNYKQNGSYQRLYNVMENMWRLIHDNDFMMVQLGANHPELFPNIIGHCGVFYATEYIQPFQASGQLERLSREEWKLRLQRAILIMDYVDELTNSNVAMCDIKYNQFGRVDNTIKYLAMDHVHPSYFIDRILSDQKPCWKDLHCAYKHCKSKCDREIGKCSARQMNNNYQVLCDQVLRGTTYSPGLLATNRATPRFLQLLDRCADPKTNFDISFARPFGPGKQLFDQLRSEVINMYDALVF